MKPNETRRNTRDQVYKKDLKNHARNCEKPDRHKTIRKERDREKQFPRKQVASDEKKKVSMSTNDNSISI